MNRIFGVKGKAERTPLEKKPRNRKLRKSIKLPVWMEKFRNVVTGSIARKILAVYAFVLTAMAVMMVVFIVKSVGYNHQYEKILENVYEVNYIRTESAAQPNRMMMLCVQEANIAESGETEIIDTMQSDIEKIAANIGNDENYASNQRRLESVKEQVDNYTTSYNAVVAAGDGTNFPNSSAQVTADIKGMNQTSESIIKYCNNLLSLELERSTNMQTIISENYNIMITTIVTIFIVVLLFSTILCFIMTSSITKPINRLKREIALVAGGDLSRDAIEVKSHDEVHDLSTAFNEMSNSLREIIGKVINVTKEIEHSTQIVSEGAAENTNSSIHIATSVDEMVQSMDNQNAESEHTMVSVTEMDRISEKISKGIIRISDNANESMEKSERGSQIITEYVEQLSQVNAMMNEISKITGKLSSSTQEMNQILNSITEISDQTSLLSLNASIEAARAGEAGRGFAVVAAEIRKLADDTQAATGKINNIITNVNVDVSAMSTKMQKGLEQLLKSNEIADVTKESFAEIKGGTEIVNSDISEIVQAVESLSDVVSQVYNDITSIVEEINANSATTKGIADVVTTETANLEEVSASAMILADLAQDLKKTVSQFKLIA